MVVYIGKIIPINNEMTQTEPPTLPVCQVEEQKDTGDNNTIIKHGKGIIRFWLPASSETKHQHKQHKAYQ